MKWRLMIGAVHAVSRLIIITRVFCDVTISRQTNKLGHTALKMHVLCWRDTSARVIGGTRAFLGELVPDTGAVVLFVLAPHLVVVVEVFDGGLDGHVLRPTRVSVDGHGVGLLLITNGGRARVVRRARARGTRAIIHVMGVVVRPFVGPASVLMATRAVISILPRALLASSASTIVTVSIRAMVVTIGAMVIALTIRTTSSTSSAGGILVRATALLVGAITGVIGGSLLLFLV
jgi:hypothetical protein